MNWKYHLLYFTAALLFALANTADTVDELVMQRRDSKREVQDILLEAMKKRSVL